MTDRVHPSAKSTASHGGAKPSSFPKSKPQRYAAANQPAYRPRPYHHYHHRHTRRRSCFTLCFWFLLLTLILLLLVGVAGTAFYIIYRPHRPSFTVNSLTLSYLNITPSSVLNSRFDLNFTAVNPSKKIAFVYDPISISVLSDEIDVGDGIARGFEHGRENATAILSASILRSGSVAAEDGDSAGRLKADLRNASGFPLRVILETKVKAKMGGSMKTPKVGIRVSCDGITVNPPAGKKPAAAATSDAKCKVGVRLKIWKWIVKVG